MKKLLVIVPMVLAALISLAEKPIDKPVLKERKQVEGKWCSLGTSITWYNDNVGASNGRFTKGYQTRVLEQIDFTGGLVNKGVNGGCLDTAIKAVEKADFYTIEHGINDWGHGGKTTPPGTLQDYVKNTGNGTFAATYRKIIDAIKKANPKAKIVLCTPRRGYGFGGKLPADSDSPMNGVYLKDYANVIREIAKKEGFQVADFFQNCGKNEELAELSIDSALHPNDAGYQKMANELVNAIMKVYPKAKKAKPPKKSAK